MSNSPYIPAGLREDKIVPYMEDVLRAREKRAAETSAIAAQGEYDLLEWRRVMHGKEPAPSGGYVGIPISMLKRLVLSFNAADTMPHGTMTADQWSTFAGLYNAASAIVDEFEQSPKSKDAH